MKLPINLFNKLNEFGEKFEAEKAEKEKQAEIARMLVEIKENDTKVRSSSSFWIHDCCFTCVVSGSRASG
jgi:hypothetical protein